MFVNGKFVPIMRHPDTGSKGGESTTPIGDKTSKIAGENDSTPIGETDNGTSPEGAKPIDLDKIVSSGKKGEKPTGKSMIELEAEIAALNRIKDKLSSENAAFKRANKEKEEKESTELENYARKVTELTQEVNEARQKEKLGKLSAEFAKRGISDDETLMAFSMALSHAPDEAIDVFFEKFTTLNASIASIASEAALADYIKQTGAPKGGKAEEADSVESILGLYKAQKKESNLSWI